MAKASKNARAVQRAKAGGSGKNYVKVVKPVKNPATGSYSFLEKIVHKDDVKDFFSKK